ncbi:hypothetical protein WICPIJ_000070 [Wickerhamomyces pijperi]|uniref:Polyadenylation factor subunit 2 n=1 Tax=Wickerhamomyces pijperi TaxID=599730 RepID=A0A9P8QEH4_WICPI|nr:hypothetical protein WICPIJ_000070 [Wickerhamomyces pijperi]
MNESSAFKGGNQGGAFYAQSLETQLASQQRKTTQHRRIIDHGSTTHRLDLHTRFGHRHNLAGVVRPEASYTIDMLPSVGNVSQPHLDTQTKFVHLSSNKAKHTIHSIKWTPDGRRLLVASHSGEFTLWNGMAFNFESITQAHDSAILALEYSNNDEWLLSGDQDGVLKFWEKNFNNVNVIQSAHTEAIRDISFSPNDSKFVTCSDDRTLKVFNFSNSKEEVTLKGHNWDVKTCDWHPTYGLIVSGSKDNLVKLWDPRTGQSVSTLHGFKHTISKSRFQPQLGSNLLSTISRDRSMRVFDLRTMKDVFIHRSDVDISSMCWNPVHANMLTTGSYDGSMSHFILNSSIPPHIQDPQSQPNTHPEPIKPYHTIPYAHEKAIHSLEYHPMGHILTSAGADRSARFWSRSKPNDPNFMNDPVYNNQKQGAWYFNINNAVNAVMAKNENVSKGPSATARNGGAGGYGFNDLASLPGLNY